MFKIIALILILFCQLSISLNSQELILNSPYNSANELTKSRNAFNREKWFYEQRIYPFDKLPDNCLQKSYDSKIQMRLQNGVQNPPELPWRSIGPNPGFYFNYNNISGRCVSVKYDPMHQNIVYIGGANGGLWKSINYGNNFSPLTDKEVSLSTGSICFDPFNTDIIYAGTGEANYSGDSYYGSGILKSTDGGITWVNYTEGLPTLTYCSRIVVHPVHNNRVYAAMGLSGLYWSTNYGATWSLHVTGKCDDIVFEPSGVNSYIVGTGSGYRKSSDGGVTYLPAGGLTMGNRNHIAICRNSPNVLYFTTFNVSTISVFKSTNSGANFNQVSSSQDFNGIQAWYDFYIHCDPADPNIAYLGSIDIWRTTNGGNNFINITGSYSGGIVHPDQHNLDFNPANPSEIMAVNDGGVWKSTNRGNNWINLNSSLVLTQFYRIASNPSNALQVIGGTQDNGIQKTSGAKTWSGVLDGDGCEVCYHTQNNSIVLSENPYNFLVKSTDGGNNWVSATNGIYGPGTWIAPILSHPTLPGVFYTAREVVFKSTNWGSDWFPISTGTSGAIREMAICKSNPNVMYVSSGVYIFRSTNGGVNFESVTSGLQNRFISSINIHPDSANVVVLTYSGFGTGKVYKTTNAGSIWMNISGNLPDSPVNDLLIYHPNVPTGIYYAAMDIGVFYTENFGSNWIELADSLPNSAAMSLDYNLQANMIRVATHGRGVWEIGEPIGIINYSNEIPKEYMLSQNYPNPFNPETIIKYDIVKSGYVKLAVYDILGRELKSIVKQNQQAGTYTVQFDGSGLSSGVYFYKLQTEDYTETRKMIITK